MDTIIVSVTNSSQNKLTLGTALSRALRLKCPVCGKGKLFTSYFKMPENCAGCGMKFEESPGYFLGSSYINYGLTAVIMTTTYLPLHFLAGYSRNTLIPFYAVFCVLFPLLFFRHARSFWLAIDKWIATFGQQNLPGDEE